MNDNDPATGVADDVDPADLPVAGRRRAGELGKLCRMIREQFTGAVREGDLDLELANSMLVAFGMHPLRQRWEVRLDVTVRAEVTAVVEEDAFDSAATNIEEAFTAHGLPLQLLWDSLRHLHVRPLGVDPVDPGH